MIKFTGVNEMLATLRRVVATMPNEVAKALYAEAQIEMTESNRRVPVKFGVLRASGFVQDPEQNGKNISVTLGYGGAAKDYAIPVHENLEAHHPHGQAKYLESVLNESRPYMLTRIGKRINLEYMK